MSSPGDAKQSKVEGHFHIFPCRRKDVSFGVLFKQNIENSATLGVL